MSLAQPTLQNAITAAVGAAANAGASAQGAAISAAAAAASASRAASITASVSAMQTTVAGYLATVQANAAQVALNTETVQGIQALIISESNSLTAQLVGINATVAAATAAAASLTASLATAQGYATAAAASDADATTQAGNAATSAGASASSATAAASSAATCAADLATIAGGPVASVAGFTGVVTAAQIFTSTALLGTPTAPTATPGDNSTTISTTAFVTASFAPLASPTFTGSPSGPTPTTSDSSTRLATTAYVKANLTFSALGGSVAASQMPALTGAVTTSAGSTVTTISSIANDTAVAGDLLITNSAAPTTPASGKTRFYVDMTQLIPNAKNASGVVSTMVVAFSAVTNQFLTSLGANGAFASAQPSFGNLSGAATVAQMPTDVLLATLAYPISGSGSTILTGLAGWIQCEFPCTINSVTMLADQSGSITVDIWKCTFSQYAPGTHPVVGDSICASDVPAISSASKMTDSTLTGWTTSISAGDVLAFNVKVASVNITQLIVMLKVTKT